MFEMDEKKSITQGLTRQTHARLLEVAGEMFAERGFRGATVREICSRAKVNIASVNYHFGGKEALYAECLTYWLDQMRNAYPPDMGVTPDSTPEQRLHAFIRSFVFRILDNSRFTWYGKLIARNMVEPTPFLNRCCETSFRPMAHLLAGIIREIVGTKLDDKQVELTGLSIVGQIVFHVHSRPIIDKLFPQLGYEHADLEYLADHITQFSLAGLRQLAILNQDKVKVLYDVDGE